MASGRAHDKASLVLALPVGLAVAWNFGLAEGLGAAVGCGLVGLFLEPDLDQEQTTESENRLRGMIGPFYRLWQFVWYAYAMAIPHRSPLSHVPGLSTSIRILYLLALFLLYATIRNWDLSGWNPDTWPAWAWPVLRGMFVGLCASDAAHWLMDFVPLPRRRAVGG